MEALLTSTWFQILLKLILGGSLSGIIGLERSSVNKPAGFGTHAILGTTSVLVVLCSAYLSKSYDIDMSRIPAQFIGGIGFIGAGTIIQNGFNVKGVTTAAGILSVTCIGISVGAGYYIGAVLATILTYVILVYSHTLSDKLDRFVDLTLKIKTEGDPNLVIKSLESYLSKNSIVLKGLNKENFEDRVKNNEVIEIVMTYDAKVLRKNKIITEISTMNNVKGVFEN